MQAVDILWLLTFWSTKTNTNNMCLIRADQVRRHEIHFLMPVIVLPVIVSCPTGFKTASCRAFSPNDLTLGSALDAAVLQAPAMLQPASRNADAYREAQLLATVHPWLLRRRQAAVTVTAHCARQLLHDCTACRVQAQHELRAMGHTDSPGAALVADC
jgi:hypothetical protein